MFFFGGYFISNAQGNKTDSFSYHSFRDQHTIYGIAIVDSIGAGSIDWMVSKMDTSGNTKWSKTYGGTGQESLKGFLRMPSSTLVYGATRSAGQGLDDMLLVRFDTSGNVLQHTIFGRSNFDRPSNVQMLDNHLILGGTTNQGFNNDDIVMVKLHLDLTIDTTLILHAPFNESVESVTVTAQNGLIVLGSTNRNSGANEDMFCMKIDSAFQLEWSYVYYDSVNQKGTDMVVDEYNHIYMMGNTDISSTNAISILKLNENGEIIWQRNFGTSLNDKSYVLEYNNGVLHIGGYTQSVSGSFDDFFYAQMDTSGEMLRAMTIALSDDEYLTDIYFDNDKIYLSGPFKHFGLPSWSYFGLEIDTFFNSCGLINWVPDTFSFTFSRDSFAITIDTFSLVQDTSALMLQSHNVDITPYVCNQPNDSTIDSTGSISRQMTSSVSVYPVPVFDKTTITSAITIHSFSVTDMYGRTVLQPSISPAKEYVLDLSALPQGQYVLKCERIDGSVVCKKLVKTEF